MAERGFHVGQRVVVVRCGDPQLIGQVTTIMTPLRPSQTQDKYHGELVHETDLEMDGAVIVGPPECFEPLRDDGGEKAEWSECLWSPKPVKERA